ncbi:hypothetical protein ACFQV2_19870 [Actinokineospora soli]|uniref:Nitroreductase n=1 Tax=Actinokineospora soli TaxID=1048753 RepID=A0ABW2TPI8_9PSEU
MPSAHRVRLGKAAGDERCWLRNVDEAIDRARLQTLIARAHRAQTQDLAVRAELAAWSGHDGGRPDGVPLTASGPRPEPQDEWLLRDFGGEAGRARTPGKDFESSPLILVLQSYSDGPAEQVQAGQALQRVLLTVTSLGLSASLISQPIEVAAIRGELRRMLGSHLTPQAVLRVGYGSSVRPTPRRPITDLVVPAIEGDPVCAPRI